MPEGCSGAAASRVGGGHSLWHHSKLSWNYELLNSAWKQARACAPSASLDSSPGLALVARATLAISCPMRDSPRRRLSGLSGQPAGWPSISCIFPACLCPFYT
eukprot:2399088-Pyramimonas_sp.AAC.1